ncbi:hypothetical protein C8Q78DRAFT_1068083 [Trametes maxima]|nr:hypothetical protein C8Q78DRAFT_1068083 [Trametes maxima]
MHSYASSNQPHSLFCHRLPPDVILHIALELATIDILGPPRHLPPLLQVCRYVYNVLSANKKALMARIYRSKFDLRAAQRRLGATTLTNSALAFQLKKQTCALKRLRTGDITSHSLIADLWTAFIMFLENDGRNYAHLVEYAHIDAVVERYMDTKLWAFRETNLGWPIDSTPNSLVVWMLWFTMSPERLSGMSEDRRGRYMDLLRPFALMPVTYYPFFAPDVRFDLPDEDVLPQPDDAATQHGFFPTYRDPDMVIEHVFHFGRQVTVMPPLIGLGARMAFLMLAEAVPYDPPSVLAVDRAHADPADGVRPTQADFLEWATVRGVKLYKPGVWDWLDALSAAQRRLENDVSWRKELKSVSASFDNDWNRLAGCYDPRHDLPLKGVVYTFGSIAGMFAGRMQIPDLFRYRDVVQAQHMPELTDFPLVSELPVFVRFTEHHCIDPQIPVPTGTFAGGFLDDVQNAYFPQSVQFRHVGHSLHIDVPGSRHAARYEDYIEGKPNSHNPRTCRVCTFRQEEEDKRLRVRVAALQRQLRGEPDDMAVEEEDVAMDAVRTPRSRSGSVSSQDSDTVYYFGDGDNRLYTHQLRLERDREAEAIVDELMSDGLPDDYEEYIDNECSGIQDIIITGEVLPQHAEAWHHYRFYGRVRKWDGLIVLVRLPTLLPYNMKTIFRGYLIGNKNFVGSWRTYSDNPNAIPLEGPFALSRIEETSTPASAPASPTSSTAPAAVVTPAASPGETRSDPRLARTPGTPRPSSITATSSSQSSKLDMDASSAAPERATPGAGRSSSPRAGGSERVMKIYAGSLFDPETLQLQPRRVVTVSQLSGLVLDVQPYSERDVRRVDFSDENETVDLRDATVLPGFVDAHVHLFLHPYAERTWDEQLTKESLVERTVRATVHARRTLMAGYTTVRDLGTEGAEDADVQLRKCLSGPDPLIPGPRYFCANRAIIASGSYGPKSNLHLHQEGVEGVTGAELADGEVECAKAVRKQVGAGADWIKLYADVSTKISGADIQTFSNDELSVLVRTARQLRVRVAAHAQTWRAELLPENGGVDTLEHGSNFVSDALIDRAKASRIIWVPTLAVFYSTDRERGPGGRWDRAARNFQRALARGMTNIACGGDTGPFPHGDNALEMKLMVRLGADWRQVLRWATLGGWQAVRSAQWEGEEGAARLARVAELEEAPGAVGDNEVAFGMIRRGFAADLVATRGDLEGDFEGAVDKSSITFVMKGGKVFKRDGREVV